MLHRAAPLPCLFCYPAWASTPQNLLPNKQAQLKKAELARFPCGRRDPQAPKMVCGGFACSKNCLCALNLLYTVSTRGGGPPHEDFCFFMHLLGCTLRVPGWRRSSCISSCSTLATRLLHAPGLPSQGAINALLGARLSSLLGLPDCLCHFSLPRHPHPQGPVFVFLSLTFLAQIPGLSAFYPSLACKQAPYGVRGLEAGKPHLPPTPTPTHR